jgi:long-chain fatty acid transport protein
MGSRWRGFGGLAFVAVVCAPSAASASGYSVARFGGEHGHPTTSNATAIYYNPAGIALSDGYHVFVDGSFAWRKVSYTHAAEPGDDTTTAPGANTGRGEIFNILASPMVGVTGKFGDFALGAAFFTPFGGQSDWDKNEAFEGSAYPGPVDGVARWYAISGEIRSSFVSLAAAYELSEIGLSIGLAGNLILSKVHTLRAKTATGDNNVTSEGRSLLDVSGTDWSLGFGAIYEAVPKTLWIGASYQSRPGFGGKMELDGELTTYLGAAAKPEEVYLETALPDVYRLGLRWRPDPGYELRLFGDYQRWSALERHCVVKKGKQCEFNEETRQAGADTLLYQERDWDDTFGVRAGGSWWINQELELFSGLGFSSNAVPNKTLEPALPDWDGFSVSLGGRMALIDDLHAALSYTQLFYLPRDNQGESTLDDNAPGTARGPDTGGKYTQSVGVVNVNVDFKF